jgi:hypothetical protein
MALRTRVSMSPIESLVIRPSYQLALITPGISPFSASCRKQSRQIPNLLRKPRGRPQRQQRLRCRTASMGVFLPSARSRARAMVDFACFAFLAVVAMCFAFSFALLLPEWHSHGLQQRQSFRIGAGGRRNRNVHALGLVDFGVVDFRKDQLIADP